MAVFESLVTQINPPESPNTQEHPFISPGSLDTFSYVSPSTQQSSCIITSVSKPECSRQLFRNLQHDRNDAMLARRLSNSVFDRLAGQKPQKSRIRDKNLTFCPKLNPISVRLAQERSDKMNKAGLEKKSRHKTTEEYTFQPVISERSSQLVRNMDIGFLTRQQNHLEKKEKFIERSLTLLHHQNLPKRKKLKQRQQSFPSSTPPSRSAQREDPQPFSNFVPSKSSEKLRRTKSNRSLTVPTMPFSKHAMKEMSSCDSKLASSSIDLSEKKALQNVPRISQFQSRKVFQREMSEMDRFKRIKVMAEKISRAKKVFMVKGGYKTVCKSLRDRGWVEAEYYIKKTSSKTCGMDRFNSDGNTSDDQDDEVEESESDDEHDDEEEYIMLSRALKHVEPWFIWTLRRNGMPPSYLKKEQIFNHFSKPLFTTKCGLYSSLHCLNKFAPVDQYSFFPRCYELTSEEGRAVFTDDYRLTAAMSILKIVGCKISRRFSDCYQPSDRRALPCVIITDDDSDQSLIPPSRYSSASTSQSTTPTSDSGVPCFSTRTPTLSASSKPQAVPEECVLLAIRACEAFIRSKENTDIDQSQIDLCPKLTEADWNTLISFYYSFVLSDGVLLCSRLTALRVEDTLEQVSRYHSQLSIDGVRNLWIVKPGSLSRGRGIVCKDHLEDILSFVKPSLVGQWVVQKYVERPLLIHSTKFDIRQWFLVTDWNPLTMWMYKTCYLRFSSQVYSSKNLDRSIHLCNNSVQKNISISGSRSDELPADNMWDCVMFKEFLRNSGNGDKWDKVIYPGMIDAIKCVLMVAQDEADDRKNTFELYGADFLITTDYNPWLIEINCSPTMERNTSVTKKLCKEVMEDTIKVVVDRRSDKHADTGNFELAYKQAKLDVRHYVGINLCVEGTSVGKKQSNNLKHECRTIKAKDLSKLLDLQDFQKFY